MPRTRRPGRRPGQNTVEFAFVSLILFTLLFGVIEMGWLLFTYHEVTAAAREGARYAAVHGSRSAGKTTPAEIAAYTIDPDDVREAALKHATLPQPAAFSLTISAPDGNYAPKNRVEVQARYRHTPLVGFILPSPALTLGATSTMLIHF